MRRDHAGERGSHFRAQGNGAVAFIDEIVELADDFVAALGREKFQWLSGGPSYSRKP